MAPGARIIAVQPKLQYLLRGVSKRIFPRPSLCMSLGGIFSSVALTQGKLPRVLSVNFIFCLIHSELPSVCGTLSDVLVEPNHLPFQLSASVELKVAREKREKQADESHYKFIIVSLVSAISTAQQCDTFL